MENRDCADQSWSASLKDPGNEMVALWETGKINIEFFAVISSMRAEEKQHDKIML